MHVVNTLEEGRRLLRHLMESGGACSGGKPSPPAGEGLDGGAGSSAALYPHAPSPLASLDPLPQGERVPPASRAESKLQLCSPPYAACYAGVNYYRKLIDALHQEFPEADFKFTLDCGDNAAIAFAARRMGFDVILSGAKDRVDVRPDPSLRSG